MAQDLSAKLLADRFGVKACTIRNYVDPVHGVLYYDHNVFLLKIYIYLTDHNCNILSIDSSMCMGFLTWLAPGFSTYFMWVYCSVYLEQYKIK